MPWPPRLASFNYGDPECPEPLSDAKQAAERALRQAADAAPLAERGGAEEARELAERGERLIRKALADQDVLSFGGFTGRDQALHDARMALEQAATSARLEAGGWRASSLLTCAAADLLAQDPWPHIHPVPLRVGLAPPLLP